MCVILSIHVDSYTDGKINQPRNRDTLTWDLCWFALPRKDPESFPSYKLSPSDQYQRFSYGEKDIVVGQF